MTAIKDTLHTLFPPAIIVCVVGCPFISLLIIAVAYQDVATARLLALTSAFSGLAGFTTGHILIGTFSDIFTSEEKQP
jgi:Na+/H+-translocating membrane pyrophosphatase